MASDKFRDGFVLLDIIPAHAAIIDLSGEIVQVNRAWRNFASENGISDEQHALGTNYLEECRRAVERGCRGANTVLTSLQKLLDGNSEQFRFTYPCHSEVKRRWFELVATPFGNPVEGVVVLHINTTHARELATRYARSQRPDHILAVACAWCKRVKQSESWIPIEEYIFHRFNFLFTHGICPECLDAFDVSIPASE